MSKKVVLAFSGGLDTTYCVKYLSEERGLEVHTAIVQTGGFSDDELKEIEEKAYTLGVKSHITLDQTETFYDQCVKYLVFGNALRYNTYPLSVSAERVFQALAIAEYAKSIGADSIAHGSTGAGNDQIRFDMAFKIICPEAEIITPIRDNQLSRQDEIDFLISKGVDGDWAKSMYSINQGLWGTSVGGKETLGSRYTLPEEAYPTQVTETIPKKISLTFEKGELVGIDGKIYDKPVHAIQELNKIASPFGIGRDIHVGDTIIGIKGRVGFEAAAPVLTIKAHHLLEKHTLTKWQLYWKEQLGNYYGMLTHEGQWIDPVMRNIEKFLADTQDHVSGEVFVTLYPYRFELEGIESKYDLMNDKFGAYGEMNNAWTGEDARGFATILANQNMIFGKVKEAAEETVTE
ncbi:MULTISPECIES: argininosuccinate synthase [Flammeovirga]|uniref:argininosuccinate synthase n=1 Tax=Flammeovirga agarivorans TaxID=2726742 RepID=A0A7X8SH75_9BACT|nr:MULTISPECIES: argininosuccinate synthase domain-containing protein [Flammeovirga]NLR90191.1 argininosuccinate synthase [Flammeovirga agarivorans]